MSDTPVLVNETPEQMETRLRKEIRTELETSVQIEYEGKFEIWKAKELADLEQEQNKKLEELVKEYYDKLLAESKPPSNDDIQQLLSQEYTTFTVPVRMNGEVKNLTIGELPMEAEQAFYRELKSVLQGKLTDIAALVQSTMDMPLEKKIEHFLNAFDSTFDILADATRRCLNWEDQNPDITKEWIKKNLSSNRQYNIVKAQMMVNRLRDFFSQVSQNGMQMSMMSQRPSVQQLLQALHKSNY